MQTALVMLSGMVLAFSLQQAGTQEPRRVGPTKTPTQVPVYRELKAGETRVEGLLQRVECPGGKPVTFTMRVAEKPERFEAPSLGAVEYIAYTPDFKGPMSCGGRGRGDRVMLTWRQAGKVRRAVAVEFLPKDE